MTYETPFKAWVRLDIQSSHPEERQLCCEPITPHGHLVRTEGLDFLLQFSRSPYGPQLAPGGLIDRTRSLAGEFQTRGPVCFQRIDDPFMVVAWERANGRLTLARDPGGRSCLYYTIQDGCVVASNSLSHLLEKAGLQSRLSADALDLYLGLGFIPAPYCIIEGVHKVAPGTTVTIDGSGSRTGSFLPLPEAPHDESVDPETILDQLEERLVYSLSRVTEGEDRIRLCITGIGADSLFGGLNTHLALDLLTGNQAKEIDPKQYGGAKLRITGEVKAVDDANVKNLGDYVVITVLTFEFIERIYKYHPERIPFELIPEFRDPRRYAILFSGGINKSSNKIRYWNGLKFMYSALINKNGFIKNNIAVLYANGKGLDTQMPVHYSATQTNLETVFNLLRADSTGKDFVFIFTTNHGGGFCNAGLLYLGTMYYNLGGRFDANSDEGAADNIVEKNYNMDLNSDGDKNDQVSWDEEFCSWGGSIFDDDLGNMFANIKYKKMVIVMEQCFSGGLIREIGQNRNNMVIISAAAESEPSYCMNSGNYDEFSYYFTCAINGADPNGKKVNADTNNDKKVSMVEAFNYARSKDTQSETPQYEDSGDGISHSGKMPASGEGTLGSKTFLKK